MMNAGDVLLRLWSVLLLLLVVVALLYDTPAVLSQ
jgi:hypothetical protein